MKKKIFMGISVILLLTLLLFSSPTQAADFTDFDFGEDPIAIEVDLVGSGDFFDPDAEDPDVIYDLITEEKGTDSNPDDDIQFFMAYMNDSGIEVAFSALEKVEIKIILEDLLPEDLVTAIKAYALLSGHPEYANALGDTIFEVNATAPFQQLVQHFTTPWESDAFVVNNYMSLIAYSSNETDRAMDEDDKLFLGYTFSVQALITKINEILANEGSSYSIDPFNYEASFEETATGYKFGINYTNMFVLWQKIDVEPKGADVLSGYGRKPPGGIIYGQDIVAASVFDHIAFEYNFETEVIDLGTIPSIEVILGNVTTQYHIGETNLLITLDDDAFITDHSDNWTGLETPFTFNPSYTVDIPVDLLGLDLPDIDGPGGFPDLPAFPDEISIPLPEMAFYTGDAAKVRMKIEDSFGLTIATATNWLDIIEPKYTTHRVDPKDPIGIKKDGNTFFWTSFQDKENYKLKELEFMGYSSADDHEVIVTLFDPAGWSVDSEAMKAYFIVEFALAYMFTKFVASKVAPDIAYPGSSTQFLRHIIYFTFTEFPEWYGGEIIHDPAYSAVAALAAVVDESSTAEETSGPPDTGDGGGIPGFEILSVLLAIPPLYALYRKRRA